ncbi:MAG: glycoside hydrolase [Pirellula sp.]|nr:glycoside hydrolase [Pirellula sp.]
MTRSLFVLLAFLAALFGPRHSTEAADPQLETFPVFPAGMDGVTLYRIPGMVVTPKGTVLAYVEARRNTKADWGEIEVHLRRSIDGGKSWLPPQKIAHQGERIEGNPRKATGGEREQTVNNPVMIVDAVTGSIEMLYCINYARCFSMRSLDDGVSWSAPIEITATFEPFRSKYPWTVIATGPGHGVQMPNGRLIVPIWLAYGKNGAHAPSAAATIYSDDHGKSWRAGDLVFPNEGEFGNPNETMVTVRHSGDCLLVNRNVSKPNRKLVSISPDGARNWSTPQFQSELWEPICMASIATYRPKSGVILYSAPRTVGVDATGKEIPAGRGKREKLTIQWSEDDGKTWPHSKLLVDGPSAYSDLAVLPDGTILCLYEGNGDVEIKRLNWEWLQAKSLSESH